MAVLVIVTIGVSYAIMGPIRKPMQRVRKGIDNVPVSWEIRLKDGIKRYIENEINLMRNCLGF